MEEELINENRETLMLARQLSDAIKNSGEYFRYSDCLARIKEQPELYNQVNELRRRHFEMQNGVNDNISPEDFMMLNTLSLNLRRNNIVNEFLDAETAFGKMIQEINIQIMKEIDFDCQFLD